MLSRIAGFVGNYKNYIFLILIALLTIRVIVPQLDGLLDSLSALKSADKTWILAGIILFFAGIPVLAWQIMKLALKPLAFYMTFKVEMAGQFVNKLLPSFVGVLTLNMYYLVKKGHTGNQAATVMTANALASGVAYTFLIILALVIGSVPDQNLKGSIDIPVNLILFILILLVGATYFAFRSVSLRAKLKKQWLDVKANFRVYKSKPLSMIIAVICNGVGSAANVLAMYASAHAIGVDLSFASALVAYTVCNVAISLVPTPGGLGAAEAGIYAGLVFTGVEGPDAITITLLYRLITYWLPIIPGYLFFWGLRKNLLSDFSFKKRHTA